MKSKLKHSLNDEVLKLAFFVGFTSAV